MVMNQACLTAGTNCKIFLTSRVTQEDISEPKYIVNIKQGHLVQCRLCSLPHYSAVQWSILQRIAVQCSAVLCSAVQRSSVQWSAIQCNTEKCSAVQCSAVQCSTVQHAILEFAATCYLQGTCGPQDSSFNSMHCYNTLQHCKTLYNTVQHCTTL